MLDACINVSSEKNKKDASPKNENNKNEINGSPKALYFTKKNIKNTGTQSGLTDCIINMSCTKYPNAFMPTSSISAPKNTLSKVSLNQFFTIIS